MKMTVIHRFLLVDDDTAYRLLLASLFKIQGTEIWEASSPTTALGRLAERPIHTVLIGAGADFVFAATVARRIRGRYGAKTPRLVALTSNAPEMAARHEAAEAFDLLHRRVFDLAGVEALIDRLRAMPPVR